MKKLLIVAFLVTSIVASQAALTTSGTCAVATNTVLSTVTGGPGVINYILLTPGATTAASLKLFDSTGAVNRVNAAYNITATYATNLITSWTNYYGVINSVTNISLVTYTNTVAAATNALTPIITLTAPTNTPTTYSGLNIPFASGLNFSNGALGANGSVNVVVGYTQ